MNNLNEQINGRMKEQTNEKIGECMNERMNEWAYTILFV